MDGLRPPSALCIRKKCCTMVRYKWRCYFGRYFGRGRYLAQQLLRPVEQHRRYSTNGHASSSTFIVLQNSFVHYFSRSPITHSICKATDSNPRCFKTLTVVAEQSHSFDTTWKLILKNLALGRRSASAAPSQIPAPS